MEYNKLAQLLKTHHSEAFRWASQCCDYRREDAEDVLQTAYLKIADGKAQFNEKSAFKTWLFSVIRFTALDHRKQQVRHEKLDQAKETPMISFNDGPDYRILLKQLPARQQKVLLLAFYHGMTLQEIADITKLHIGTVRTHYSRGKEALRGIIEKEKV